jgi:hypothetical protein
MNAQSLVAKVWNFAHALRDQGVSHLEAALERFRSAAPGRPEPPYRRKAGFGCRS